MRKNWIHYLFILVVCWFAFFMNNGAVYVDIMESRNFVTAHEMIEYDNWLVPTMNGELRLEKPPLPTWIAAAIEYVSPGNVSLQRGFAGIMATFMAFMLYFFAWELSKSRLLALLSAITLVTSFNVIMAGRVATWDIYCHAFMMGAILCFYRGLHARGASWGNFLLAGLLLGLSFLGKGPVSFYALLLPFLICFLWLYRPSFKGKWGAVGLMLLLFAVVGFWWPVYLYIYHQEEILQVFAKESSNWINYNVRPWYYYHLFFAESGIWSLFLLTGLLGWPWLKNRIALRKEYSFAVMWTVAVLVLLSCVPEKKTRYLLPLLIPASMVVAHYVVHVYTLVRDKSLLSADKFLFRLNAFIPALIALGMPVAMCVLFYMKGQMGLVYLIIVSLLFLITAWSIFIGGLRFRVLKVYTGVVILLILVETLLMYRVANMFNNTEIKSIRAVRQIEAVQSLPFYYPLSEEAPRIELIYEAGRRILPLDMERDTAFLQQLPFVLVSERPAGEIIPEALWGKVNIRLVDEYDNNPRPKNTKRYSSKFIRHVTILEHK